MTIEPVLTNRLVGVDPSVIMTAASLAPGRPAKARHPELCDGKASDRIVEAIDGHQTPHIDLRTRQGKLV